MNTYMATSIADAVRHHLIQKPWDQHQWVLDNLSTLHPNVHNALRQDTEKRYNVDPWKDQGKCYTYTLYKDSFYIANVNLNEWSLYYYLYSSGIYLKSRDSKFVVAFEKFTNSTDMNEAIKAKKAFSLTEDSLKHFNRWFKANYIEPDPIDLNNHLRNTIEKSAKESVEYLQKIFQIADLKNKP